jgi:PD-(D/E)XK nuclease superfamily protein
VISGEIPVLQFPAPLSRISPSRFVALSGCALRELWSSQEQSRMLPISPRARLGTAIHRLLAQVVNGTIADAGKSIESTWFEIIAQIEADMSSSQFERDLVPLSRSVNDYEVQRIRTWNRAQQLMPSTTAVEKKPIPTPGFGCEVWVQSRDGTVGGFIDLVYEAETGRVIRDYKSGPLLETDSSGALAIHPEYLAQLKLYAALYYETFSEWPARLELMPLQGDEIQITVDRSECEHLLEKARGKRNEINQSIAHARSGKPPDPRSLARPSASVCRMCLSRPACREYHEMAPTDSSEWPNDAWGTLIRVQRFLNGRLCLTLRNKAGKEIRVCQLTPARHPAIPLIAEGDEVGVYSVRRTSNEEEVVETSLTTIYRMNSDHDK